MLVWSPILTACHCLSDILQAKQLVSEFTEKMASSKNNPPIIRGVYSFAAILFTLERVAKALTDCHLLSEDFIDNLLKSQLSAVLAPTHYGELAERLQEERERLAGIQPDIEFLISGVNHELEVAQIGRSQGWQTVAAMEVGEKISSSTRQRLSAVRPQVKAAAKEAAAKKSDSSARSDRRRPPPYARRGGSGHYYGPPPSASAPRDRSTDKCNFCHRYGHWANECPEKKKA